MASKYGLMMGLGAGMTAAGQGVDRYFQYQMEEARQQSLRELESRRLDIMQAQENRIAKHQQGLTDTANKQAYWDAKEQFEDRMNGIAEQIVTQLPEQADRAAMAQAVKMVMSDPDLQYQLMAEDGETFDTDKMNALIAPLATQLSAGAMSPAEASAQVERFSKMAAARWKEVVAMYPGIAPDRLPEDFIDAIPAFYGYGTQESGGLMGASIPETTPTVHLDELPEKPSLADRGGLLKVGAENVVDAASYIPKAGQGLMGGVQYVKETIFGRDEDLSPGLMGAVQTFNPMYRPTHSAPDLSQSFEEFWNRTPENDAVVDYSFR